MEREEIRLELRFVNSTHFAKVVLATVGLVLLYVAMTIQYFGTEYFGMDTGAGANSNPTSSDTRVMLSLWFFLLSPVLLIPALFMMRRMRVIINGVGIQFRSGLMSSLKRLMPDWSVRWDELQGTSWEGFPGQYLGSRLHLRTRRTKYRLAPWQWVEAGVGLDSYFPNKKYSKDEAVAILGKTAVVEWVRRHYPGYCDISVDQPKKAAFGLGIDGGDVTPLTAVIAVTFIVLVFSFITEIYFTASEFYAGSTPYAWIGLSALIGFLVVHLGLKHLEPKRTNSALYALLFGLGVGLAAYPFLARVNAWTDTAGLHGYEYQLGPDFQWRASEPGPPDLDMYLSGSAWWRQFRPGDTYTFELRKGGLGFWQVNMQPIYEAQRHFRK
jgi:hypothetical protein